MKRYWDKNDRWAPITSRSFLFLIGAVTAIILISKLLDRTVDAQRLAWAWGMIGAVIIGLPLCGIARQRKFYDPKHGYTFQIAITCVLLLAASTLIGVEAGALMNAYCGKRTEYSITTDCLGVSPHGRGRKRFLIHFSMPGFPNQRMVLKEGENAIFAGQKFIELHLRSGLFNFPVIESYGIPATTG